MFGRQYNYNTNPDMSEAIPPQNVYNSQPYYDASAVNGTSHDPL